MLTALGMALVPCKDCGAVTGALQCAECWQAEKKTSSDRKREVPITGLPLVDRIPGIL